MITENTLENKAKFFAQYYGQKVLCIRKLNETKLYVGFDDFTHKEKLETDYLELKPLSQITDEDAIEIAKLANSPSFAIPKQWEIKIDIEYGFLTISSNKSNHSFDLDLKDGHLTMYDCGNKSDMFFNHYDICDYLRSKGYALPYMGLSIKDLISYQWIKLTTQGREEKTI